MTTTPAPVPIRKTGPLEHALRSFRGNLEALRIFAKEIGELADKRDHDVLKEFGTSLRRIVGQDLNIEMKVSGASSERPPETTRATAPETQGAALSMGD